MTNIDTLSDRVALTFLRKVRANAGPDHDPVDLRFLIAPYTAMTVASVEQMLERGLLVLVRHGFATSSAADRLLDAIEEAGARMLAEYEPCSYTFSHTSSWCGNPYCRES